MRCGFSVETDVRSYLGQLIFSHDAPSDVTNFCDFEIFGESSHALNIKEDGLISQLVSVRGLIETTQSFLFDASIPQMYLAHNAGLPHALRFSEYERSIPWKSDYLWIDGLATDWWLDQEDIHDYLDNYRCVFVSPELHGRDHARAFEWFAELKVSRGQVFSVCTDFPQELSEIAID